ncbi:MAG TPA: ATP-binding cassette domain-containing protein [Burkholderiales bacterium]|nr:ATP-binding cassette domain-containing protein [Burkholderiales bacterium]
MLSVQDLDLFYGDAQALDGVSLEVGEGEIVAIVGANGAGKSSLIRTIAGMQTPRRGKIVFKDQDISRLESHAVCNLGIGQVAEGRQVFPSLTVLENLEMGAMLPRARGNARRALEDVFAMFPKLAERRGQLAGTMSGGEQAMVSIGRGLMRAPKLLLIDEPSLGLSPRLVTENFNIIRAINERGITVFLVEQNVRQTLAIARCLMGSPELVMFDEPSLGLAPLVVQEVLHSIRLLNGRGITILLVEQNVAVSLKLSNRAYVLENGRIVMSGAGSQLLHDDRVRQAYMGL